MISPSAAALAISITKGVIKLGGRIDRLMAEKEATTGDLVLPMPSLDDGPSVPIMAARLKDFLERAKASSPNPLSVDEVEELEQLLRDQAELNDLDEMQRLSNRIISAYDSHLPEEAAAAGVSPDSEYINRLKIFYPSINLDETETRLAAFYIRTGKDHRTIAYAGRVALLVVDVLSEFGSENTALFVHSKDLQAIVRSVLTRFSKPELEDYDQWSPLLRHALSATLNGVLDARGAYESDDPWLGALLNALDAARETGGDEYLVGLLRSKGYKLLLRAGLSEAATQIGDKNANEFEKIAEDVLRVAAPLVAANDGNFGDFFKAHWGDLLNAGLKSLEKHGPSLHDGESQLLRTTLVAIMKQLAATDGKELFTSETLFHILDAAIGAVAQKPELITGGIEEPWLKSLIGSVVSTVGDLSVRKTFTKGGLERIIRDAAARFAENPELLVENDELFQVIVGGVLEKVSGVDSFTAELIASAAVAGALTGLSENPALLDTDYAEVVAAFAGKLATEVAGKRLSGIQAKDIMAAATTTMLENPILFTELGKEISSAIVDAVVDAADGKDERLVAGATLVQIVNELFLAMTKYGRSLADAGPVDQIKQKLEQVVDAALTKAADKIGRKVNLTSLPRITGKLVGAVAAGDLTSLDPESKEFTDLFNNFMEEVNAAAA